MMKKKVILKQKMKNNRNISRQGKNPTTLIVLMIYLSHKKEEPSENCYTCHPTAYWLPPSSACICSFAPADSVLADDSTGWWAERLNKHMNTYLKVVSDTLNQLNIFLNHFYKDAFTAGIAPKIESKQVRNANIF